MMRDMLILFFSFSIFSLVTFIWGAVLFIALAELVQFIRGK